MFCVINVLIWVITVLMAVCVLSAPILAILLDDRPLLEQIQAYIAEWRAHNARECARFEAAQSRVLRASSDEYDPVVRQALLNELLADDRRKAFNKKRFIALEERARRSCYVR